MTVLRIAKSWPGKSNPDEIPLCYHPALWHMLDVGAVAQEICRRSSLTGKPSQDSALCFLVALHDLGKISDSFRNMIMNGTSQKWRHWEHSAVLLCHYDDVLEHLIGGTPCLRQELVEAIAGHHGGPRTLDDKLDQQKCDIGCDAIKDAGKAIKLIGSCFPDSSLDNSLPRGITWLLNGLTIQSDWVGSNQEWFKQEPPDISLDSYWANAQKKAVTAVKEAGLYGTSPSKDGPSCILDSALSPRPMQIQAQSVHLPKGPVLAIVEDTTGAGKTEAALILSARMMAEGKGEGIFFGLPTMATANAMLGRVELIAPKMFERAPTLTLSHGRAKQSNIFRRIKMRAVNNPEDGPHCGDWLSADRRRVLLADVGVGTIDQALLAVLPTRFNGLRLRALSKRILIVDEAHSYEPYMQAQLERLLMMQAQLGGSSILMTATLPMRTKSKFIAAYQIGSRDRPPPPRRNLTPPIGLDPYPALTVAGKSKEVSVVDVSSNAERTVQVIRISKVEDAIDLLCEARDKKASCVWIRNAVDDAIDAVKKLQDLKIEPDLLHARFALCDRLKHEENLQNRFGRMGNGREGRILVATQVVEQSLDLDFDFMISDLCPIGSLIQRIGRLWRHMDLRPARPLDKPILYVLSPDPDQVSDSTWVHQVLDKGAYVYPTSQMWRSAHAVFDAGEIRTPSGLRTIVEAVEGDARPEVPEVLEQDDFRYEGQQLVESQLAKNSLIHPFSPFSQEKMNSVWDDEKYPTRLGVPQVTLALATKGQDGLQPYGEDWEMSEVQVSKVKYECLNGPNQDDERFSSIKKEWTETRRKYIKLAPLGQNGKICDGLRYDANLGIVYGDF